jgi:type I restriction enzyme, S subunit
LSFCAPAWKQISLGDICTLKYGKTLPESARHGGQTPVYGSNGIVGYHNNAITTGRTIIIGRKGSFGEVNCSESNCWPIDTAYFVDESCTEQHIPWLAYRLSALGLNRLNGAAAVPGLNRDEAYRQKFLLPPLPEQRRIAAILDQADALRAKRRETLAQLDSLTQSIFVEMFGDPLRNARGWKQKPIGSLGKVVTGNTPPRENAENYGDFIEWIKSDNINTPHYYLTESAERLSQVGDLISRTAPPGAILVTCIAGSPDCIGNAAMTNRRVAFNQQINAFIPEVGDPHFYYQQIIVGKKLIQMASTNGMKGMVSKGRFEQINLIVPPVDLQRKFAGVVSAIENQKSLCLASLSEIDALFISLQHRAFRGEL